MIYLTIWLLWSTIGSIIAFWFMYRWGWGDATWDDPEIHPGNPDDEWHIKRRKAFYVVAFWSASLNPVALILFALKFGRKAFRAGVKKGNPSKHESWYG